MKLDFHPSKKGVRSVQSLVSNNRQHLTLAAFANANGQAGKPFLIVPKSSSKEILNGHFQGSPVFSSQSGYMNDHLYKAWCQFFVSEIKEMRGDASKWCLLIVDGLNSHTMNSEALDILNDANVLSISLPSHSSAMLQVHDVAIFGPLKRYFDHKMAEHILKKGPNVTLKQLASIIEEPFERANSSFNIRTGFQKVGIYPLNTNWVSENSDRIPMFKVKGKEDRFIYLTQKATAEDTMRDLLNSLRHLDLALPSQDLKGQNNHAKEAKLQIIERSLSSVSLSAKDFHIKSTEQTGGKRKNPIGESFALAKILNEPNRIQQLKEKALSDALKRKNSELSPFRGPEMEEIVAATSTKRVKKQEKK